MTRAAVFTIVNFFPRQRFTRRAATETR
jgi:hypothetical protein